MRTVVIIQARMGSTRLPGKVLMDLGGKPVLAHVVDRCKASGFPVVVATTHGHEDDAIADWCAYNRVSFARDEVNPQRRLSFAAARFKSDCIVRVCADSPFLEPECIPELVQAVCNGADYAAYRLQNGKPAILSKLGITCEALTRYCLDEEVNNWSARHNELREHVTAGIYSLPSRWVVKWLPLHAAWLNLHDDELTTCTAIDTQEDLDRARSYFEVPA